MVCDASDAAAGTGDRDIDGRIVRYAQMVPCRQAFIDTRTPGSDRKENFCLVGPGVAENPEQYVHIRIPHGFNVGGARQPPGCRNSHHSHDTEEVFVVHAGSWKFTWGVDGGDGEAVLTAGDTISIPVKVFRGFENVGDDDGFLFAVLGGDDPGRVTWAPYVLESARRYGLVLLQDGRLVDTAAGQSIPEGAQPETPLNEAELAGFRQMTPAEMSRCVLPDRELQFSHSSALAEFEGVTEAPVIGPASPAEGTGPGRMAWEHGFHLRRLRLLPGAVIPAHERREEEVIFVHRGELAVTVGSATRVLQEGDLITAPIGAPRSFGNTRNQPCDLVVVRGGNAPAAPRWCEQPPGH
jgi:quercetin dioxygenase-like cupin family protein